MARDLVGDSVVCYGLVARLDLFWIEKTINRLSVYQRSRCKRPLISGLSRRSDDDRMTPSVDSIVGIARAAETRRSQRPLIQIQVNLLLPIVDVNRHSYWHHLK